MYNTQYITTHVVYFTIRNPYRAFECELKKGGNDVFELETTWDTMVDKNRYDSYIDKVYDKISTFFNLNSIEVLEIRTTRYETYRG